jgi:hypothetical protein
MCYLFMKYKVEGYVFNKYAKNCIRPATCKIPKGLGRYEPGKGFMKKINDPYYDMSDG